MIVSKKFYLDGCFLFRARRSSYPTYFLSATSSYCYYYYIFFYFNVYLFVIFVFSTVHRHTVFQWFVVRSFVRSVIFAYFFDGIFYFEFTGSVYIFLLCVHILLNFKISFYFVAVSYTIIVVVLSFFHKYLLFVRITYLPQLKQPTLCKTILKYVGRCVYICVYFDDFHFLHFSIITSKPSFSSISYSFLPLIFIPLHLFIVKCVYAVW